MILLIGDTYVELCIASSSISHRHFAMMMEKNGQEICDRHRFCDGCLTMIVCQAD